MDKLVAQSEVSKKNAIIMTISVAILALLVIWSLYKWFVLTVVQPLELMAEALVLFVLIERTSAKYTYEMDKNVLRLTKRGLLGKRIHEVPYSDIVGAYRYKPQLIGVIKFRRTYRFHSALDGRDVWTLAYTAAGLRGKIENRRFYFKPGVKLLMALQELPGKIMISEEQVIKLVLSKSKGE
ncbi:hypothetical protein SPSIL_019780 [Sporomusa silvacetica DSM 10669]|uniref:Bacterial Pleckstrin homology domain-containing protein n=1 Tax=Sporomusa silvacetica DSM 10669 TaxID=1123289 RepID=A0ABZ3IJG8_9FIRM|nr:hypothetical protein SPSIL_23780 [Sporomusa silvacetica DSM 10669]